MKRWTPLPWNGSQAHQTNKPTMPDRFGWNDSGKVHADTWETKTVDGRTVAVAPPAQKTLSREK